MVNTLTAASQHLQRAYLPDRIMSPRKAHQLRGESTRFMGFIRSRGHGAICWLQHHLGKAQLSGHRLWYECTCFAVGAAADLKPGGKEVLQPALQLQLLQRQDGVVVDRVGHHIHQLVLQEALLCCG